MRLNRVRGKAPLNSGAVAKSHPTRVVMSLLAIFGSTPSGVWYELRCTPGCNLGLFILNPFGVDWPITQVTAADRNLQLDQGRVRQEKRKGLVAEK